MGKKAEQRRAEKPKREEAQKAQKHGIAKTE